MDRQGGGGEGRAARRRRDTGAPGIGRRLAAGLAGVVSSVARALAAVAALGWLAVLLVLAVLLLVGLIDAAVRRSAAEAVVATVMALSIGPVLVREWRRRGEVRSLVSSTTAASVDRS